MDRIYEKSIIFQIKKLSEIVDVLENRINRLEKTLKKYQSFQQSINSEQKTIFDRFYDNQIIYSENNYLSVSHLKDCLNRYSGYFGIIYDYKLIRKLLRSRHISIYYKQDGRQYIRGYQLFL